MEGMTIARAPLRITLGGGATDLPSYSESHGGFCLTAAIDRYRPAVPGWTLSPG